MKGFLRKWNEISLIKRIVCGLAMGAVLALLLPDIYVIGLLGALKAIAPLLVFFLVIASLARAKAGAGNMSRVVGLYLIGTFLAALTAVAASFLFPVNITLAAAAAGYEAASGIGAVLESLLMKVVETRSAPWRTPTISASWPGRRCSAWRCAGQEKRPKSCLAT